MDTEFELEWQKNKFNFLDFSTKFMVQVIEGKII